METPTLHDMPAYEQPADDAQFRQFYGAARAATEVNDYGTSLNSFLIESGSKFRVVEEPSA